MIFNIKYLNFTTVLLGLLLLIILSSCVRNTNFPIDKIVICDAEQTKKNTDKFIAANDSAEFFSGGRLQTNLAAHTGKLSALTIPKTKAFAFGYKIKYAGPDAYFKVSVWRKSKDGRGALVVAGSNTDIMYLAVSVPVEKHENGWEKLEMEAYTPPHFGNGIISIYVWNNGKDTVFFDDLVIESKAHKQYPAYDYYKGLEIVMDTSDYLKIMKKRKRAFENGILQTSGNDWVKSIVVDYDKAMKAKIRLKGDWLDHLRGDKWSYRVKMRKENTFNRLRTFSLQTPSSRSFLLEWLTHKLYHENDVLTTRYGFIPLMFNNKPRGIYAWEEHFVKQLPEWNNRREGPIVKFSEDPFWQVLKMNINYKRWPVFPFYQAAIIIPFGQSRTVENPVLYKQFLNAQKLMHQYKNQQKSPSEIFDLDKLAKYYAMLELTHARHGMAWHNQRMYYNPVICKLEPIAFDGYSDHSVPDLTVNDNMAYRALTKKTSVVPQDHLISNLFTDTVFLNNYMYYLEKYSRADFVNTFMNSYEPKVSYYDSLLRLEFPYFHYNDSLLVKSAKEIRSYLPELKEIINDSLSDGKFSFSLDQEVYNDTSVYENTPEFFVNVYTESETGDSLRLNIYNYFTRDLIFLGTGKGSRLITAFFMDEPVLPAYSSGMNGQKLEINVDTSANYLFFMIDGRMDTYSVPVLNWPYPSGITPQQELCAQIDMVNNPFIERITGNKIYIKSDSLLVNKPFIIPEGYEVYFSPGTLMNLINHSMFISYSPVYMTGTAAKPIRVTSSDFSANGFTVLQAKSRSMLNHVVFENLNTLDYKGWTLTGAVNFYESDVDIIHTRFYRNQCEDALNTIRSDFKLEKSTFDHIYGDAFDSDFCTGLVTNCRFISIGNDAIDFSGSQIQIIDTEIIEAKDKGISGGEDSYLTVENTTILRSNIGLASKDLSTVNVKNSSVIDCNYGIVLLQKKPEYGPAIMTLTNTSINNAKTIHLIEIGSEVVIDGKKIKGNRKDLADIFY